MFGHHSTAARSLITIRKVAVSAVAMSAGMLLVSSAAGTASASTNVLETLGVSQQIASGSGFSKSIESTTGQSTITPSSSGMRFYNPAGDRRTELGSDNSYGEGSTIWIQQNTVLQSPWPAGDSDSNFLNWVAKDSGGYGADIQVASQATNGSNRLHAWIYPLGSATRTGAMNWNAALVYNAPLPAAGSEIDVSLGLTLSSDPAKGSYELWINGHKVAAAKGRTLFSGSRVYGKFGIYGGPSSANRSAVVKLWQVTSSRPTNLGQPSNTPVLNGGPQRTVTLNSTAVISGTAPAGSTVDVYLHRRNQNGYSKSRSLVVGTNGTFSTSYLANDDYRYYAAVGTAASASQLAQLRPDVYGPASRIIPRNANYTVTGTARPGTTVTIHFHRAGMAMNDYSILRQVTVSSTGKWSRTYLANTDYRLYVSSDANQTRTASYLLQAR